MLRLFDINLFNHGWWRGLTIDRPGLRFQWSWTVQGWHSHRQGFWRFVNGICFSLGGFSFVMTHNLKWLREPVVYCSRCKRMQPREFRSPIIGSPEWEKVAPKDRTSFKGQWIQDYEIVDGKTVHKPWRWIGPCCEENHSGWYGDTADDENDAESEWVGQCCICGGEVWLSESSCDCEGGPTFDW